MAKVFGIAKMTLTMTFQDGQINIRNEFHIPQLVRKEVLHVHIKKKLDIHHRRWRPYLIGPLRHSWHYGGQAPR